MLAFLLATQGLLAGAAAVADVPAGTWVELDGQSVLEERIVAAGAQSPQEAGGRISHKLLRMAQDSSRLPDRLVVDQRGVRRIERSQRALVERYRDQLQAAINQSRSRHSWRPD